MIISLHLPKTAGTSFISSLENKYTNIVRDYSDKPLNRNTFCRNSIATVKYGKNYLKQFNGIELIHGHFLPFKYTRLKNKAFFITWLREPAERLASHYYFWKKHKPDNNFRLHKKVYEDNWSFERFAFSKELRNVYSKFLWNFPLNYFSFIGITEYFEEDFTYFSKRILKEDIPIVNKNINNKGLTSYFKDKKLKEEIRLFHSLDYKIYEKAVNLRDERK